MWKEIFYVNFLLNISLVKIGTTYLGTLLITYGPFQVFLSFMRDGLIPIALRAAYIEEYTVTSFVFLSYIWKLSGWFLYLLGVRIY